MTSIGASVAIMAVWHVGCTSRRVVIVWSIGSVRGVSVVNMWRVRSTRSLCEYEECLLLGLMCYWGESGQRLEVQMDQYQQIQRHHP